MLVRHVGAVLCIASFAGAVTLCGCKGNEAQTATASPATSVQTSLQTNPNVPDAAKQGAIQDMEKARGKGAESARNAAEMKKQMDAHGVH